MAVIGLLLGGPARDELLLALSRAGHEAHIVVDLPRLRALDARARVDAWIFDARREELLEALLETTGFLLPADNIPDGHDRQQLARWVDSLLHPLELALAAGSGRVAGRQGTRAVWLLAGSAGATAAVQQFFNAFTEVPPVGFIYAQHLDPDQVHRLEHFTLQNKLFSLSLVTGVHTLVPGEVGMISPRSRVTINRFAQVSTLRSGWDSPHTPDIGELLVILAAAKVPAAGTVLFSGMGNDGAAALGIFAAAGGQVWAQSPASAVSPGMPAAAIATGRVHRTGNPVELAQALQRQFMLSQGP